MHQRLNFEHSLMCHERACLFLAKTATKVVGDTESSAGADATATYGAGALGLLTMDSGIDDACVCVC